LKAFLHKLLFLVFGAATLSLSSQVPAWGWSSAWASNGDEIGRGVFVDSTGFTYQVGSFTGSVISLPSLSTSVNSGTVGSSDIFISKIDKFGVPVWQVKAGGSGNDVATCVTVDNNGNVYVGGYTQSSNCIFYGSTDFTLTASSSNPDFFVAKYNSSGSVLWVNTSSGSGSEEILAICCDNSFVYAGGYFTPNLTIPSIGSVGSNGGQDMLVLKYNLAGTIIWAKAEGGSGTDVCTGIACDQSNIYICGSAGNGITYAGSPNIVKTPVGAVGNDITFARLNASGDVQWAISEGNTNNCSARSISVLKNNVVVGGVYVGALPYSTTTLTANANNDMFLASHDRNGIFKNVWSAATAGEEVINSVATDSRFIYVSGNYANTVNFGGTSGVATSTSNLFVACYDTLFSLQFVKFGTGNSANRALACHSNQNGITSLTGSYNGNTIQFAPLSAISPSLAEDFYVAGLTNCDPVLNNTITGNQQICSLTAPIVFTASSPGGGNGTYYYYWQQSTNSTTWAPAAGTNSLTIYTSPSLSLTTYFRRVVTSCAETSTSNIVTVTVVPLPTSAAAGSDQLNLCGVTSTTINGNTPTIGTGLWTIISGIGGSFVNATSPTSTFNGVAGNSYTLQWTISNSTCTPSFDNVSIVFNQNPSTSAAGPDQLNLCGVTSATLSGNTPAIGTGSWTLISGTGGSFVNATNPTSTFNGVAGNSYTLQWTISNGPCTSSFDDVSIVFNQNPSASNAGLDQLNLCGVTSATLSGNTPAIGTGSWTVISGAGGSFANAASPISSFNGVAGNSYTLQWTISNAPCAISGDDVSIVFNQNPTQANAGADQTICGSLATLSANSANIGSGNWTVISGAGGNFLSTTNPLTSFNGSAGGTYVLRWTISNAPCVDSFDDVSIELKQNPSLANAGVDQSTCSNSLTLSANAATVGNGSWSVLSGAGGIFLNSLDPASSFSGVSGVSYALIWTISNDPCVSSSDVVNVIFYENPTPAKVGADQTVCGTTITLIANTPLIGSGEWSRISGGGNLNAINSPTLSITNMNYGLNEFVWKISNLNCPVSADTIGVRSDELPSRAKAGDNQETVLERIILKAESPEIGIGKWSVLSGQGTFENEFDPNSAFTFLSNGPNYLLWTVSNGVCKVSSDTLLVNKLNALIPEIITPNSDGNNDYFYLSQADYISNINLEIYNRWGSLEYKNSNYKNEFNGKNSKGVDLADDTYFILLTIPGEKTHSGYLIIKRK